MMWIKIMKAVGLILTGVADILLIMSKNKKAIKNISKE